ncbi:hypothetical protein HCH_06755 [Hahella chejuensis KCTC 2396]|uniref:Uncharacterized protein n=2 Tax=Hahella chejuensis TaxID=158327 RepID=Q2S7J4_HAHCH|nr:hypothetical protein HCH_06755 [Hahella chejuensis KCTC 2396]
MQRKAPAMERKYPKHNGHVIAWLKHLVNGGKYHRRLRNRNERAKQTTRENDDVTPVNNGDMN